MTENMSSIADALQGPLGGMIAILTGGAALMSGKLRHSREIEAVQQERDYFKARFEKSNDTLIAQLQATDRAIGVARAAMGRAE